VVVGEFQSEIAAVFEKKAKENNTTLTFASEQWCYDSSEIVSGKRVITIHGKEQSFTLNLDLTGTYQIKNLKTVLSAVAELKTKGFEIPDEHITSALSEVKNLTGLMGRWQTLQDEPLV